MEPNMKSLATSCQIILGAEVQLFGKRLVGLNATETTVVHDLK